jgi:RNA polymerase sigma-70 factor (ECF subfamily)
MPYAPPPPDISAHSVILGPASTARGAGNPDEQVSGSLRNQPVEHTFGNGLRWFVAAMATALAAVGGAHRRTLERIAEGDAGALRELYDAFAGRALSVAMRIVKETAEAEDIVQEVFVDIWRRASQYTPDRGGVGSWIVAIVRNRAIDRVRATGTARRAVEAAGSEPIPSPSVDPTSSVDEQRERERVRAALDSLSPGHRRVIELAYFEGLSQSEIASQIGEPLGTIKSRMRAAMSKLAAELQPVVGAGA